MKANAPEKIYINPMPNPSDGYVGVAWSEPHIDMKEYTHTDAFIEKAIKYITNHFLAPGMDNEIKDFVNYMKGDIDQCINSEHSREGLVDLQKVIDFISDNILDYIDVQTLGIEYSREFDKERFVQDFCSCR